MNDKASVLRAKISELDKSRSGYLAALTRVCNEIDVNLSDYKNLEKIHELHSRLLGAFDRYQCCCQQYANLLDESCGKYLSVMEQYQSQLKRKKDYSEKINLFTASAVEVEVTRLEQEIAQTEKEIQETLEMKRQDTKDANARSREEDFNEMIASLVIPPPPMFSDVVTPDLQAVERPPFYRDQQSVIDFPSQELDTRNSLQNSPELVSSSPVYTVASPLDPRAPMTPPYTSTPLFALPSKTTVLPLIGSKASASKQVKLDAIPDSRAYERESLDVIAKNPYRVPDEVEGFMAPNQSKGVQDRYLMFKSFPPRTEVETAEPHLAQRKFVATTPSAVENPCSNEGLLTTIASAISNISMTQDLPKVQVQKFDGSPEKFPTFRQRFSQMVESRNLNESVKMTLLLQFLEGQALKAVQRYEALPGGLTSVLKTLQERFGRPTQVVRACVDALTNGPAIQNDKRALQQLADDAQATYYTLHSMGYLGEMNTDSLERIIARLPKWAQTKFVEATNRKKGGQEMPTFKDVVDFLQNRAEVMNHPFLARTSSEVASPKHHKVDRQKTATAHYRVTTYTITGKKEEACLLCEKPHRLYRCELFKAKSPKERNEFVKTKKLCFNCLSSTEHTSKTCKCLTRCQASGCGKPHHSLLHFTEPQISTATRGDEKRPENDNEVKAEQTNCSITESCSTAADDSQDIMLQVLPLKITDEGSNSVTTYCLIDSGSDVTLVDPSLIKELNIKGKPGTLCLNTVSDKDVLNQAEKVSFTLAPIDEEQQDAVPVETAWAVKELTIPLKHTKIVNHMNQWPHLRDISFPEVERKKISVLIGTNVSEAFIPLEVRRGKSNAPIAIKSSLGWSILGGAAKDSTKQRANSNFVASEDLHLSRQLEEFWKVDSYGTHNLEARPLSVEDQRALKQIDSTITKNGDHYQIGLLWKDENVSLPYNRKLAEARLQHLKKRFRRDPELESKYRAAMKENLTKGYARKLTDEEAAKRSNVTWYLPHHLVLNPNKPNKVRIVFDAAAKFAGVSLNDCLLQGPCLTNDLPGVLIRFRQHEAAFTADIEGMFNQVEVTPADTDALRFLWWPESTEDPPQEYQMLVHIFGARSSPCCANKALKTTAEDNKQKYDPQVIKSVHRNFYVDDVLKSTPTTEEAVHVATELVKMLREGGFSLKKFASNRREILAALPQESRVNPTLDLDLDQLPIQRTLGISWDAHTDTFQFKVIPPERPLTKRGILSVFSSLFDPLGFLAPYVLPVKILLQDLWRKEFLWDQEIPEPFLTQWLRWLQSLPSIVHIRIPRCYRNLGLGKITTLQLHHFSDASRRGYAAVSYLRMVDEEGRISCAFVMGKSRNTPLKEWTIPRLELQAAVLATRLNKTILRELEEPVDDTYFWSDSMTTLQYVRNKTRRFHTFVANRLTEIHESTTPKQWHFVPGNLNPADEGSRGMDIQSFHLGCRWWRGPDFLWKHEGQWPKEQIGELPADDEEIRPERNILSTSESNVEQIFLHYSSWPRMLRVMSWVLRFVRKLKKVKSDYQSKTPTLAELKEAGQEISRLAQRQVLREDYTALVQGRQVKAQSKIVNLNPTLVDGVIRVGGRIHRAPIAFDAAHPIILPREHPVSVLIVRHYHRVLGHAGREHVLSVIRQTYWILGARSLVKKVLPQCVTCRKGSANPMKQKIGDLPKERLVPYQPPFTYTGLDFFGPFHVKRGRSTMKVYGCIFVCFNSRAVHIEDVSSLETDAFLQALRRFIAVRGSPKEIWSDNGTNFTGADKELRRSVKELDAETIERELHSKEVEWHCCPLPKWQFQPPTASNMSGVWERLIRSVRKAMKGVLGDPNAIIGWETLRTVFAEVTSILNSRPLCPCSDDPNDVEPLTPNHFLLQKKNIVVPPGVFGKEDLYGRKQWRQAQFLADCIWTRWLREYIPTLQQRQRWTLNKRNLAVNDLVLITDSSLPRSRWLLGRVTRVFPGEDNRVRVAEIKTKNSLLVRPVNKLCLVMEAV